MNLIWKKWWRHVDGEVSYDNGFKVEDHSKDLWYFNMDSNTTSLDLVSDLNIEYEDCLFESENDAITAATNHCIKQISSYKDKLLKLT